MNNPLKGDYTLYRARISRYNEFIVEYELVKKKEYPDFVFVKDWAAVRKIEKKNFLKYYGRYRPVNSVCVRMIVIKIHFILHP